MDTPIPNDTDRFFIGIEVPAGAGDVLKQTVKRFTPLLIHAVPRENWHVTLVFIGPIKNAADMVKKFPEYISLSFVPTLAVTHIGRGKQDGQLWAYIQLTPSLEKLRRATQLVVRENGFLLPPEAHEFTPHVTLGNLSKDGTTFGLTDAAAPTTFPVKKVILFRSVTLGNGTWYEPMASAKITP